HDLLARLVRLGAAEGPEHRVREGRGVAEGVAERLAVGLALLLEGREDLGRRFPRLWVLARAGLLQPRLPVRDGIAHDRVRRGQPLAVDFAGGGKDLVEAAFGLA